MNKKLKSSLRKIKLTGLFTAMIFAILLLTNIIAFSGMVFMHRSGILDTRNPLLPVFFFAIASLILGTVIAAFVSNQSLKPLQKIIEATDKIADGDYSPRVNLRGPEEFRELGRKFNHMAEELGSVEMLRSDFINNFSHEFKTPIVSIRGFAKMLQRSDLTEEERNEYLETIISESERLTELAANVLSLSKIEGQSILTDKKQFNVSEQIRLVIALLDGKWSSKNITFDFDCGERYIVGNEELLKQVWINLLDNAVKFSPCGGTVTIRITELINGVKITIADEGSGISAKALPHIFDKFYQGDTSHTTKGNGLGLTIASRIIKLHDGRIRVDSNASGTTFDVELLKEI